VLEGGGASAQIDAPFQDYAREHRIVPLSP
jgi:hypothetical protein